MIPARVVLSTDALWVRADGRLPPEAAWLPGGPRTRLEHQLDALEAMGVREVTLQTRDAARWTAHPPRTSMDVRVLATRQDSTVERLDELMLVEQAPLLVIDAGVVLDGETLRRLCVACVEDGHATGIVRVSGRVAAAFLHTHAAKRGLAELGRTASLVLPHLPRVRATRSEGLHEGLTRHAVGAARPAGWVERAPGVFAEPTAVIAADALARCEGPVWLHAGVQVAEGASLVGPVALGEGVQVASGATVVRSFVAPRTRVAAGVALEDALVVGAAVWTRRDDVWSEVEPGPTGSVAEGPDGWARLEQAVERSLAGLVLLAVAPVLMVAAVAIRAHDGGSLLYQGRRCVQPAAAGQGPGWHRSRSGRFVAYPVLRTMTPQADRALGALAEQNIYASGPFRKAAADPRVTPVGRWLRKASVDELPLLFEVFRGRLRLTGVWALPTYEATELADPEVMGDLAPVARLRFGGAPGLAGYWQARDRKTHDPVARIVHDAYQAVALSASGPFAPRERVRRRLALAVETILSALRLSGV